MTRLKTFIVVAMMLGFLSLPIAGIVALRVDVAEAQQADPEYYPILTSRHKVGWTAEGHVIYKINNKQGIAIACVVRETGYLSGQTRPIVAHYPLPLSACFQE